MSEWSDWLRAAYDPELFRVLSQRVGSLLADHLRTVEAGQGPVLNWRPPADNIAAAAEWLHHPASTPSAADLAERWEAIVRAILSHGQNLHHPRYIGHQVPASIPLAGVLDSIGAITNQPMAIYEMGPWATAVERAVVDELGARLGFAPGSFAGFVTHGGSLANLTALLTARNVALGDAWERGVQRPGPPPVLLTQADAHYSIARAAGILGLGADHVLRIGLDERRRMDPHALRRTLRDCRDQGRTVIAVAASCCTTPIGAFDPLTEIAPICREFGVWLHVDAAHGGGACLSARYRSLVEGIEHADSVVWDSHKMLFVPALCACVFYKDRGRRFEAFRQNAPYLFDPQAPGMADYDIGLLTVECTKRAAAFALWGVWSLFGPQLFTELIERTFSLGRTFYELLQATTDFQPLHEPQCNIQAFRYTPAELRDAPARTLGDFQFRLRRSLIESGEFYITATALDGVGALRVTIMNPLTTTDELAGLLEALRRHGRRMLSTTS